MTDIDKLIEELREYATDWRDRAASKDVVVKATDTIAAQSKRIEEMEKQVEAYKKALDPDFTKAAYMGEFSISVTDSFFDDGSDDFCESTRQVYVDWTTIKEIMAAIRDNADKALKGGSDNG